MMPALRLLGLIIIGGLVTIGVIADQRERTIEELPSPVVVTASDSRAGTWFCAGGSGSVGAATVGLEVVNAGLDDATVDVQVVQADEDLLRHVRDDGLRGVPDVADRREVPHVAVFEHDADAARVRAHLAQPRRSSL